MGMSTQFVAVNRSRQSRMHATDVLFDRSVSCCETNHAVGVIFYLACIDLALTTFLEVKWTV